MMIVTVFTQIGHDYCNVDITLVVPEHAFGSMLVSLIGYEYPTAPLPKLSAGG